MKPWYVFFIMLLVALSACTRKSESGTKFRFTAPPHPNLSSKTSNMTLSDSAPNFCYFVNVIGNGISPSGGGCSPLQGLHHGFIASSTTVEMSVPKGGGRTVEIFGFLAPSGQACDPGKSLGEVPLNRLFLMGRKDGIDMSADTVVVDLNVLFPGITQHFGVQSSMDIGCYAHLPPIPMESSVGSPVQVGRTYVVKSRLGLGPTQNGAISGSIYKVRGGVSSVIQ